MSWEDRLRDCVYTAPSGSSHTLAILEVERQVSKKAAVHELAGRSGARVQDNGNAAEKLPVTGYIGGADYDIAADALADALKESGPGTLQHPRWGEIKVLPLTFSHKEDLVNESRVALFTIDFVDATDPAVTITPKTAPAIQSSADVAASLNVAAIAPVNAADAASIKKNVLDNVKTWRDKLASIKDAANDIKADINKAYLDIVANIDSYITSPADLCGALTALARLPARLPGTVKDKLGAYKALVGATLGDLLDATIGQAMASATQLCALVIAAIESATAGDLLSRDDAMLASDTVKDLYADAMAALDSLRFAADATLLETLADMLASIQAYLLDQAYSLRVERRLVLTSDRNPLDLIYSLYPEIKDEDATLDAFIAQNALSGDEILVIPRGREVRYYA